MGRSLVVVLALAVVLVVPGVVLCHAALHEASLAAPALPTAGAVAVPAATV